MSKIRLNEPKRIGEILDLTFQITKKHFSSLFLILFVFMGPVFLIQALTQLMSGRNFFRDLAEGENWIDQMIKTYDQTANQTAVTVETSFVEGFGGLFVGLLSLIFYPIASAAIFVLIKRLKDNESYTVGSVIKTAFSRFWPILWSSLLFGLIAFAIIFIPLMVVLTGALVTSMVNPITSIAFILLFLIGGFIGIGLLLTRWGFYLPAVLFDRVAPGLGKSWALTEKRTWKYFWIYIVLGLIMFVFNLAFDVPASFLGVSVLYTIIMNFVALITTLFFTVGHAVMYFDAEVRNTAGDLKGLIDDYQKTDS
ncbi:hypothetical protein GCM10011351_15570 [Paraliobacillus quinghaiensis]|uniref:Glycerophosphoryl diester phosphodiesterase membrane domain-containing protein n=1 Tax=Paraliobacillus quinghaiensis TaxID=470815 RepID=A0A917TPC1_9BACI|nr:hypothetical protein [Paraliobacillus quinghaiensis]GGM30315.1 hypothetical protein GCM10011351_15570 [Paraliobacillus quinghaiensis]